jgi:hypothetical protein
VRCFPFNILIFIVVFVFVVVVVDIVLYFLLENRNFQSGLMTCALLSTCLKPRTHLLNILIC